jgi:hypothetical protein
MLVHGCVGLGVVIINHDFQLLPRIPNAFPFPCRRLGGVGQGIEEK